MSASEGVGPRVDNVGSLLRPPALIDAFARWERGALDGAALTAAQDIAVREVVAAQERIGVPVVTDGEYRRSQFMESFAMVAGFTGWSERHRALRAARRAQMQSGGIDLVEAPSVKALTPATEPLSLVDNRPLAEFAFAQALTERPVKATLIGPDRIYQSFDAEASTDVYPDSAAFLADVVAVQRAMIDGLVQAGCRYVHMDAPGFTAYVDPTSLERMRARGWDPQRRMTETVAAENAAIRGHDGVTFGIHLCRGNEQSHWHREGSYDAIAEQLFATLEHQRLLLEYDTERAGGFAPLRFVPHDKVVVLGLVTSKSGALESRDEVLRRIEAAGRHFPVERMAISPQCGFASVIEGNRIGPEEQWRKFELLLDVADEVWG
jgi:5-methyltetrahydropteroyltriglutamate--homocysteine methyltransferase